MLIRIRSVGVCASDIHYYEHGRIGRYVVRDPLILGHEPSGEVVALGSGVTSLAEGDRVSIEPGVPCRACVHCRTGHYNLCDDVVFMATPPVHGAFVEYVAHPADFAYRIPDHVSYDEAALIEPLSVGLFAARRGRARLGDRAAILGAGPIGLMTLLALQSQGIRDVTLVDVEPFRLRRPWISAPPTPSTPARKTSVKPGQLSSTWSSKPPATPPPSPRPLASPAVADESCWWA